jgi:hypothetical protein
VFFVLLFLFVVVVVSCAFFLLEDLLRLLEDLLRLRCSENCEKRKLLVLCVFVFIFPCSFLRFSRNQKRTHGSKRLRRSERLQRDATRLLRFCLMIVWSVCEVS